MANVREIVGKHGGCRGRVYSQQQGHQKLSYSKAVPLPIIPSNIQCLLNSVSQLQQLIEFVGEIFTAAGAAFNKLSELIMTLHSVGETSPSSGKWTAQEMEMLKTSVKTFSTELERINESIKSKNVGQIKGTPLKRKSFEDPSVGIKKQQIPSNAIIKTVSQDKIRALNAVISQSTPKSADITLNMLNAMEPEVDVEGLTTSNKLDYDSSDAS